MPTVVRPRAVADDRVTLSVRTLVECAGAHLLSQSSFRVVPLSRVALVVIGVRRRGRAPSQPDQPRPTGRPGSRARSTASCPTSRLVNVAPNCMAAREAGPSLARIFAMAREINDRARRGAVLPAARRERSNSRTRRTSPATTPRASRRSAPRRRGTPVGHSYHGWGKAADLTDAGRSLTFVESGLRVHEAGRGRRSVGTTRRSRSRAGARARSRGTGSGSATAATSGRVAVRGDAVALLPSADDKGYAIVDGLGGVRQRTATSWTAGSAASIPIAWVMVGAADTRDRGGYWMVGADGGVFSFGNAHFYGSTGGDPPRATRQRDRADAIRQGLLAARVGRRRVQLRRRRASSARPARCASTPRSTAWPATPSGNGYWLVASDGGVFSFGDADFYGSTGAIRLNSPIVGIAPTPTGKGYWMVASDGGVFTLRRRATSTARSRRSTRRHRPIGIVPTKTGQGLLDRDRRRRSVRLRRRQGLRTDRLAVDARPAGGAGRARSTSGPARTRSRARVAASPGAKRSSTASTPMRATARASVAPGHTWGP